MNKPSSDMPALSAYQIAEALLHMMIPRRITTYTVLARLILLVITYRLWDCFRGSTLVIMLFLCGLIFLSMFSQCPATRFW